MMSCGDLNGSFSLWHISWFEFYQQVGVMPGAIGSQAAAVAVKDKDGIPCGIETVRAVVRKALRRDVPRAVVYFLVNLKHWTLVGQSDRMQRFIGGSRAQGMVEFLAKLLVQNALATALPMGAASLGGPVTVQVSEARTQTPKSPNPERPTRPTKPPRCFNGNGGTPAGPPGGDHGAPPP
jgi:hypothetical protein